MTGADRSALPGPIAHKVRADHLDRSAVVYIRQSTPQHVAENREADDLQYLVAVS